MKSQTSVPGYVVIFRSRHMQVAAQRAGQACCYAKYQVAVARIEISYGEKQACSSAY